jgi:hypothetical protein
MMILRRTLKSLRRCVDRLTRKISKKKLKELEKLTNNQGKEFLKGLMDEKEKWALAHDKCGKCCGYMTSNMVEIFNSLLREDFSLCLSQQWLLSHSISATNGL